MSRISHRSNLFHTAWNTLWNGLTSGNAFRGTATLAPTGQTGVPENTFPQVRAFRSTHPLKGEAPNGTPPPPGADQALKPDRWLTDGQDVVWPPAQQEHSAGSPRVMAEEAGLSEAWQGPSHLPAELGLTVEDQARLAGQLNESCRQLAVERDRAIEERDKAQRFAEQLWPANLLEARVVDPFPVIAAIVHELGRPTGEWSVQVERQSMTTDDGEVDVELVSLHRVTGRTA
jgi:hypothetical protein